MSNPEAKSVFDDLESLRVIEAVGPGIVREVDPHIPLGRPGPQTFFQVDPHPEMSLTTTLVFDSQGIGKEPYLVVPEMRPALIELIRPTLLMPVMTRQGVSRVWP